MRNFSIYFKDGKVAPVVCQRFRKPERRESVSVEQDVFVLASEVLAIVPENVSEGEAEDSSLEDE